MQAQTSCLCPKQDSGRSWLMTNKKKLLNLIRSLSIWTDQITKNVMIMWLVIEPIDVDGDINEWPVTRRINIKKIWPYITEPLRSHRSNYWADLRSSVNIIGTSHVTSSLGWIQPATSHKPWIGHLRVWTSDRRPCYLCVRVRVCDIPHQFVAYNNNLMVAPCMRAT